MRPPGAPHPEPRQLHPFRERLALRPRVQRDGAPRQVLHRLRRRALLPQGPTAGKHDGGCPDQEVLRGKCSFFRDEQDVPAFQRGI